LGGAGLVDEIDGGALLRSGLSVIGRWNGSAFPPAEERPGATLHVVGFDVSHHEQRRVVRTEIRVVEPAHVRLLDRVRARFVAGERVSVRGRSEHDRRERAVRDFGRAILHLQEAR
jgi:hypothetical protein